VDFDELNPDTREQMWAEFLAEEASGHGYRSSALSPLGLKEWPELVRVAFESEDEEWLADALSRPEYWQPTEQYVRNGVPRERRINVKQAAERLAQSEFNTWYVRGLARKLIDEGVEHCEVYRAGTPKWEPAACAQHEGLIVPVSDVYDGHRARYWPFENQTAFAVPFHPGCHHSIRRVS
jgi:hypothetical protein